jgi:hypothetical protein
MATPATTIERVRFEANQPETITLRFSEGRPVEGRYGPQVMYSLIDGRVLYAEPELARAIEASGASQGDTITVTKRQNRKGRTVSTTWEVERHEPEPAEAMDEAPAWVDTPRSEWRQVKDIAAEGRSPMTPMRAIAIHEQRKAAAEARREAPERSKRDQLWEALTSAIDAAAAATKYAQEKGLPVLFASEDIRAMALSLYISADRAGGVR